MPAGSPWDCSAGNIHQGFGHDPAQGVIYGLVLLGSSIVFLIGLNFVLYAIDVRLEEGRAISRQVRELFLPLLPGQLATAMLATILAIAYRGVGLPMLLGAIAVLLILQHLTVALLRSEDRAEQLEARSIQLVGLQLGVLRTLGRALNARDKTTGQHAGAVASYARALAVELDCSEEERDVVHTAGLLHEIGKFTWPDRVLHAEVVQEADLAIVRNHPQEGATLVGALDGYGEVADAILYHHERVDGGGYPAGLIGNEIPLASRVLAICSAYDTMTAGRGYRSPLAPEDAMGELRHAARNGQFDSELVETFVALLERDGVTFGKDADYDTELAFEQRVKKMAEPHAAGQPARGQRSTRPESEGNWRSGVRNLGRRALNKG